MQIETYHADTSRVSKSGLDKINVSPADYYYNYLDPSRPPRSHTKATLEGELFHTACLEPDTINQRFYLEPPVNKRTNAGKQILTDLAEMNEGKYCITQQQADAARYMRDSALKHPLVRWMMESAGVNEHTILFTEQETGVPCKCRPDRMANGWILDFKSCEDASPEGAARSSFKYRYYVQAPFYLDGYEVAYDERLSGFMFVFVEKDPPYKVAVYTAEQQENDLGREHYIRNLLTYKRCKESGFWPGLQMDGKSQGLSLPGYAYSQLKLQ